MARRHVIIGGGPAAVAAAEAIRGADRDATIVMVVADPHGYYSRPGLAYYLVKELPEKRLFPFTRAALTALDLDWVEGRALAIEPATGTVTLADGRRIAYDRLLLATGSRAVALAAPGSDLDGVVKLDDLDDARDIARRCRTARSAVVVGGGITALEIVEGMRARGVRVHYLMRQDRYWRNVLAEPESRAVERRLRADGVDVRHGTEVAAITGRGGRVVAVETGDGETLPCEIVAVAIGVRPQVALAAEADLPCARGVLVDQSLRTSDERIFAAGDIAETGEGPGGRPTLDVLWNSAVAKGRVAGLNMAREAVTPHAKGVPLNITRLAGLRVTIIGTVGNGEDADLAALARGDSQTWSELGPAASVVTSAGASSVRLELGAGTILGAVVIGDQTLSFPLQELIEARADVTRVLRRLQEPGAPVGDLIAEAWRDHRGRRA